MKRQIYIILAINLFLFSNNAISQSKEITEIRNTVEHYSVNALPEKLYVHTDKSIYLNNEVCWFKIYTVDGIFHEPLNLNKIAYVELLDANNQPVAQEKIELKDASGQGSIKLPINLPTGKYTLVAYTNWMKNFDSNFFFKKSISIINTQYVADIAPIKKTNYNISIFPESGSLLSGIKNTIGFSVTNNLGQGILSNGWIIRNNKDTISQVSTMINGLGSNSIMIDEEDEYKMIFLISDTIVEKQFPKAQSTGAVLQVSTNQDSVVATIYLKSSPINSGYLVIHNRGIVKRVLQVYFTNEQATIKTALNNLGDGINVFSFFDLDKKPIAERLYFKYPEENASKVILEANYFKKRQKINLTIQSTNSNIYNASMAVYKIDSLQKIDEVNIENYIWLSSDLYGKVESPDMYFNKSNVNRALLMDNLMLTKGWRRYLMKDILQGKIQPILSFLPEMGGSLIGGKLSNANTKAKVDETAAYISSPSINTTFTSSISDSIGRLRFQLNNFKNDGQIIVQAANLDNSNNKVEIENPFVAKNYFLSITDPIFIKTLPKSNLAFLHRNVQIQNLYTPQFTNQIQASKKDTNAFYYKPDRTYFLDDYARFTTLEEVIREYVTPVSLVKKKGKYQLYVYDEAYKKFFESNPLVLLDGVVIQDIDKFLEYDPLKIRKLEVVSRTYFLGNIAYSGIINFTTYKGKLESFEIDPKAVVLNYSGLQDRRIFAAPVYETQAQIDSRIPDFRQLLYWNPNLNFDKKIATSFYSSDVTGKYYISIQGVDKKGKILNESSIFEVK
jgi:hypothetical protein